MQGEILSVAKGVEMYLNAESVECLLDILRFAREKSGRDSDLGRLAEEFIGLLEGDGDD